MEIRELRNPASVGWRRVVGSREVEVAWPRGSSVLLMSTRTVGDTRWRPIAVMDSERWGHDGTYNGALARAHEFLAGLGQARPPAALAG